MPREVRERQMMDAAVATFGQRGYRAASMDEIAELAGVSKPLVYLYLNSKEELFTACIRREADALLAAVRAGVVEPGIAPDQQLWAGLTAFFAHTAEHPDAWSVLHRQARTHGERFADEVAGMREELVSFVTGLLRRRPVRRRLRPSRRTWGAGMSSGSRRRWWALRRRWQGGRTRHRTSRPGKPRRH